MNFLTAQQDLDSRLSVSGVSGFWTPTDKKRWLNLGQQRALNYRRWPFAESAKTTITNKDQEYYDYPTEFRSKSIGRLDVDGAQYLFMEWEDYLGYTGSQNVWSEFGRQYFITPIPDESDKAISVWGILSKLPDMANDSDESEFPEEGHEAIVLFALAIGLRKSKMLSEAREAEAEAFGILDRVARNLIHKREEGRRVKDIKEFYPRKRIL